jgi:hypothetical protein
MCMFPQLGSTWDDDLNDDSSGVRLNHQPARWVTLTRTQLDAGDAGGGHHVLVG